MERQQNSAGVLTSCDCKLTKGAEGGSVRIINPNTLFLFITAEKGGVARAKGFCVLPGCPE